MKKLFSVFNRPRLLAGLAVATIPVTLYGLGSGTYFQVSTTGSVGYNDTNYICTGVMMVGIGNAVKIMSYPEGSIAAGNFNIIHNSSSAVIGTWNKDTGTGKERLIVGNGNSNTPSNAMELLDSGQTKLINKGWNSMNPLIVPTHPNFDNGNALVVEGHTRMRGKVIIEQPQGDISMGIFE